MSSVVLVLAASAKQGHLISCCLQEGAVCYCCFCYSEPPVINLLFLIGLHHTATCQHTRTHTGMHIYTDNRNVCKDINANANNTCEGSVTCAVLLYTGCFQTFSKILEISVTLILKWISMSFSLH